MAVTMAASDRQPSPNGIPIQFSSNNPFRNRTSPPTSLPSNDLSNPSTSPFADNAPPRFNMSNNPFLDSSEVKPSTALTNGNNAGAFADELFKDLTLQDKPAPPGAPRTQRPPPRGMPVRPPGFSDKPRGPRPGGEPRPRRLSESSVAERRDRRDREQRDRPPRTESEERHRRERRKEREERHRREKEKAKKEGRPYKKPQGLDIIDKLDVTGIYGQGLFHHDGPFDACNPHRNARKNHRAPMQAFPEGSANMALGGSGPANARLDLDRFHGRGEEGFSEYANAAKRQTQVINPTDRIEQVHGDETYGLGTSTFLEGAPASRKALQRRESEDIAYAEQGIGGTGNGLTRKKSLAQRLRGMSNGRRNGSTSEVMRSPHARYNTDNGESPGRPLIQSAGGVNRAKFSKENEINVFDEDYDTAFDKKTTQIKIAEQDYPSGRPRTPSSPNQSGAYTLSRSITADSASLPRPATSSGGNGSLAPPGEKSSGGFLNRMRSIKGSRRTRPERRDS
ncbi:protein pal1 [Acrodontium crateriforme]|uniref:Protein pal1 n=1 Tax=Acrodontium crateriforme TaxID=150365 RepID=A0AAQ3M1U0_9PEZI|nr:protein pal1 [Acrodontium crateriforme]